MFRSPKRRLWRNLGLYVVAAAVMTTALGLLEHEQGMAVHWPEFYASFVIFFVVIDLPLLVLALWFGERLDATLRAAMSEALQASLPITARLFIEHYRAEQQAGNLPAAATPASPPPVTRVTPTIASAAHEAGAPQAAGPEHPARR